MDNFRGRKGITIQPNDANIVYKFNFPAASAEDANDGFLSYTDTIATCDITAYDADGTTVSGLVNSYSVSANDILVSLDYPGAGRYKLTFVITTTAGHTIEADFGRITAKYL